MMKRLNPGKSERGQILTIVVIILALAAIIIPAILGWTYGSHRSTVNSKDRMQQFYAADTGIEEALFRIGNYSEPVGEPSGDYTVGDVNGYTVTYTIGLPTDGPGWKEYPITSTATRPDSPRTTIKATARKPGENPIEYWLYITHTDGGHVYSPYEGNGTHPEGERVDLLAWPNGGYEFDGWTGDTTRIGDASDYDTYIDMYGNYTIQANFVPSACYPCFNYAIATFGGEGQEPFDNKGNVEGDVYVSWDGVFENAFCINGELYIDGNARFEQTTDIGGNIHVNGNLEILNHMHVYGHAYVNGDITLRGNSEITGDAYATGSIEVKKPSRIDGNAYYEGSINIDCKKPNDCVGGAMIQGPVTLPDFQPLIPPPPEDAFAEAWMLYGDEALSGGTYVGDMLISGGTLTDPVPLGPKYIEGDLIIDNKAVARLEGNVWVTGNIEAGPNVTIIVAEPESGKRSALIAEGNMTMESKVTVDALGDPPIIPVIMSIYGDISWEGGGNPGDTARVEAIIYAPNGDVYLRGNLEVFGSIVGLTVTTDNQVRVIWDSNLEGGEGLPQCGCAEEG